MGTRHGQIDPSVFLYLIDQKQVSADQVQVFLFQDCGLKGLSGSQQRRARARSERRSESTICP
jgi:acetate kinase